MSARAATLFALAAALAIPSPSSYAQADCAKLAVGERLRCEQAARVEALCGDFAGEARAACERHFVESPVLDDCLRLDGYGRSKCETYNQGVRAEFPCAGKAGATLALCAREQANRVSAPK
jgi:hypothetical protein